MVTFSETAVAKLAEILAQQPNVLGLRLSAVAGGCSGYQYGMELAETQQDGDWVGSFGTVKVFVGADSQAVLNGVKVDFVESLQGSGFTIDNPNAVRSCGCGKSFETEGSEAGSHGHHHSH
jgi:iron-sulfur cluster assembly accessory protein